MRDRDDAEIILRPRHLVVARRDGARDLGDQTSVKLEIGLETATASSARRKGGYRSFPRFRARRWIPNDVAKENWGSGRDRNGSGADSPHCPATICVRQNDFLPTSVVPWRAPVYSASHPDDDPIGWIDGRDKEEVKGFMSGAILDWGATPEGKAQIADLHAGGGAPLKFFPALDDPTGKRFVSGFAIKAENSIWINPAAPGRRSNINASGGLSPYSTGQIITHEVGHFTSNRWESDANERFVISNHENRYLAQMGMPLRYDCYYDCDLIFPHYFPSP